MARPPETERIVTSISAYLDRHEAGDAAAKDLSQDAVARGAGVAKRHLSRTDEVELNRVQDRLKRLRNGGVFRRSVDEMKRELEEGLGGPAHDMTIPELERDVNRLSREVTFSLRQWLSYHEKGSPLTDSPLLLADLERLTAKLHKIESQLRPLVAHARRLRIDLVPGRSETETGPTEGTVTNDPMGSTILGQL